MKHIVSILLAFCVMAVTAGCSTGSETGQNENNGNNTAAQENVPPKEETNSDSDSGKTLVVYYSATGSTETVAGYIANALDADTFEITPTEPYTSEDLNWSDESSRVTQEHDNSDLRTVELVSATVDNWDSYDTVLIGYPIWWGIAAWPLDSFVTANDFTGKTVIPFCTSSSSELGESGKLLAEMAGNGDWKEGQRFRSSVDETDVVEWLDGLGLSE